MKALYAKYGQLMLQSEILNGKIKEAKTDIFNLIREQTKDKPEE